MEASHVKLRPSPEAKAGLLSRIFFWWLNPLLRKGYKRTLEVEDLYEVLDKDESRNVTKQLEINWEKEKHIAKQDSKLRQPSLGKAIIKTFGLKYALLGIFTLMEDVIRVAQVIFMGYLIRFFSFSNTHLTLRDAYLFAGGISLSATILAVIHHIYFYGIQRIGMQIRVAVGGLIYQKSLDLSSSAVHKTRVEIRK